MREALSRAADLVLTGRFESTNSRPTAISRSQCHPASPRFISRMTIPIGFPPLLDCLAAIPSISDCLINRAMRPARLVSAGGAGATSRLHRWPGLGHPAISPGRDRIRDLVRVCSAPTKSGRTDSITASRSGSNPVWKTTGPKPRSILPHTDASRSASGRTGLAPRRSALPHAVSPTVIRGRSEVLAAAARAGLDFLAITDHNSARRPRSSPAGARLPILSPGPKPRPTAATGTPGGSSAGLSSAIPRHNDPGGVRRRHLCRRARCINHPKPLGPDWSTAISVETTRSKSGMVLGAPQQRFPRVLGRTTQGWIAHCRGWRLGYACTSFKARSTLSSAARFSHYLGKGGACGECRGHPRCRSSRTRIYFHFAGGPATFH